MEATVDWETALLQVVELPEELLERLRLQAQEHLVAEEQTAPYFTICSTKLSDKAEGVELGVLASTDQGELLVMQLHPAGEGRTILEIHLFTVQEEVLPTMQLAAHRVLFLEEPVEPRQPL